MSNILKVSLQTTIYSLGAHGWSQRRIASELGINRETVRRYPRLAKPPISIAGSEEEADGKPAISISGVGATDRHRAAPTKKRRTAIRNTLPQKAPLTQSQ